MQAAARPRTAYAPDALELAVRVRAMRLALRSRAGRPALRTCTVPVGCGAIVEVRDSRRVRASPRAGLRGRSPASVPSSRSLSGTLSSFRSHAPSVPGCSEPRRDGGAGGCSSAASGSSAGFVP